MMLRIPQYAKRSAEKALRQRRRLSKSKRFGISFAEAREKGIRSGVRQAQKIIARDFLSIEEVKPYARFYQRFKNCTTPKCEGALNLWGGRKFGQLCVNFLRSLS